MVLCKNIFHLDNAQDFIQVTLAKWIPRIPGLNDLAQAICAGPWSLTEIRPVDMTLEEIFIQLVADDTEVRRR